LIAPGDAGVLAAFAKYGVPWGIQYYLAYGVSAGLLAWADIKDCSQLGGQHVEAASHLVNMMGQLKHKVHHDVKIW
jgi:hypothetical protein